MFLTIAFRCGITVVIVLLMVIMILTMSVKQYIYNKDPQEETTIQIAGCQMNISYIKMILTAPGMAGSALGFFMYRNSSEVFSCSFSASFILLERNTHVLHT